jgi:MoaA/NifB/PqqE/SkfB family radical SAM enzyme
VSAASAAAPATTWRRAQARLQEVARLEPRFRRPRAYVNWLRANYELMTRASVIRARPLKLTFDPTNFCQLRCPLCPTGARIQDRDRGKAQRHIFEHLMEEVGDYLFLIDFFNWGEPLLNEHAEDLVSLAHRRGIVTFLSSNLSIPLSDARIERLVQCGLSQLIVSLDGATRETYGTYRRVGRFDLVVSNMQRILAARARLGVQHPQVNWQFLVFRFNQHEIDTARRMAADMGVDSVTFRAPFLDEGRVPLDDADRADVATWAPTLVEFNRYDPASASHTVVPERPRCGWHYMSSAINWDGSVAPCCTLFEKRDDFGQYAGAAGQYMRIVNNDAFRAVRDSFAGRGAHETGRVCDHCPTPFLMGYHHHVNRQVGLYLIASAVDAIRRPVSRWRQWRSPWAALPPPARADAALAAEALAADRAGAADLVGHARVP